MAHICHFITRPGRDPSCEYCDRPQYPDGFTDGIQDRTRFPQNGFAIDPRGCGCTDCLTGQAFSPEDRACLEAAIQQGRTLYNRTGHEVILPSGVRLDADEAWRPGRSEHCPGCTCYAW